MSHNTSHTRALIGEGALVFREDLSHQCVEFRPVVIEDEAANGPDEGKSGVHVEQRLWICLHGSEVEVGAG